VALFVGQILQDYQYILTDTSHCVHLPHEANVTMEDTDRWCQTPTR